MTLVLRAAISHLKGWTDDISFVPENRLKTCQNSPEKEVRQGGRKYSGKVSSGQRRRSGINIGWDSQRKLECLPMPPSYFTTLIDSLALRMHSVLMMPSTMTEMDAVSKRPPYSQGKSRGPDSDGSSIVL